MESERKKSKFEYPASHSVDTYWYAIDKDGRLASICSGEEGTLPADIDTSNDDYAITDEAMILNSEPICKGCRKLILTEEQLSFLFSQDNISTDYTDIKSLNNCDLNRTDLHRKAIELAENVKFDNLFIWKERINEDSTIIYELSEDHRYIYCVNLEFNKGAIRKDIESGNITRSSYIFDSILSSDYNTNSYTYEAIFDRGEYEMRNTFQFNLPKGFHGIKEFDISFAESDEFYLDEYTGVYTSEYEYTNRNDDEFLIWPNYDGMSEEELVKELFVAINRLRTRSVWCLLDKYNVPSDSVDPMTGETALDAIQRLYAKYNGKENPRSGYGLSCFRILRMIQLKEKQRVSNQTSSD